MRTEAQRRDHREWMARWRKKKPERARSISYRHNLKTYGLTEDDYERLLKRQKGRCAVCRKRETHTYRGRVKKLTVDHCHRTRRVRGLLCHRCNLALGMVKDDPKLLAQLASYLRQHGSVKLSVRRIRGKGRGVVAKTIIRKGEVAINDHALVFPNEDARLEGVVHRYTFDWDGDRSAVAMGLGSFVNHSYRPNLRYRADLSREKILFTAIRTIHDGEELTINYNFDPDDDGPVGFKVKA